MRTLLVPALFGLALLTIALITRSGIAARENPGVPINSAMREAMDAEQLPARDAALVDERYPDTVSLPSGIRYRIDQPGEGTDTPQPGQWVRVHYTAHFLDGAFFDTSRESEEGPFNFQLGTGRVIAGWDEIIPLMRRGERRTVIIPYWRAYGDRGIRGKVPRQATLVFDLELIDFR